MATIKDIAKETGFSVTTVSRALNGYSDVNEGTRQAIKDMAKKLGYTPNIIAQSLVQKKSFTIGFIVSNLTPISIIDNFAFNIFMGSSDEANASRYEVILIQANSILQKDKNFSQIMRERNLEGAILQGFDKNSIFCQDALTSGIPTVFVDIPLESSTASYIGSDIHQALFSAMDFLKKLGHQNIGFIHGHDKAYITDQWKTAYQEYLTSNQLPFIDKYLLDGAYSNEITYEKSKKYILDNPELTAVFCASDTMAIGLIQGAHELGLEIPENLSILGFDNILLSKYFTPSISSVSQSPFDFGKQAFILLLRLIEKKEQVKPVILPTSIIERSSTKINWR